MPDNLILRSYRGEADAPALAAILIASQTADNAPLKVSPADLLANLNEAPRFAITRDLVIAERDGKAVGFGRLRWWEEPTSRTYDLTGYVPPKQRRQGLGRALLGWLEARALAIAVETPTTLPSYFHVNTTQYQTGLQALVRQAGYTVKESWVLMVRPSLADIPDAPLPDGLEVRPVRPEDLSAIWYAVEEAYEPEGGPAPTGVFPADMLQNANTQPELWQVAWEVSSGQVVGSVMAYINHAENKALGLSRGYTEGISTVPRWQRRGVAQALIARSLRVQRDLGLTESALVCNAEKQDNYRLYVRCGFREVKRDTVYEKELT